MHLGAGMCAELHLLPPKGFADAVAAEVGLNGHRAGTHGGEPPPKDGAPRCGLQPDYGPACRQKGPPLHGATPQRLRHDHRPAQVRRTPTDKQRTR